MRELPLAILAEGSSSLVRAPAHVSAHVADFSCSCQVARS